MLLKHHIPFLMRNEEVRAEEKLALGAGLQNAKIRIFRHWGFRVRLWTDFCIGVDANDVPESQCEVSDGLEEGKKVC